jgi:hypothetical protein
MAEIKWERGLNVALEKARQNGKPIFHDFWLASEWLCDHEVSASEWARRAHPYSGISPE